MPFHKIKLIKKVEKWVSQNTKEAGEFVDNPKKIMVLMLKNPETITNPNWECYRTIRNWLTGGSTKKDNVQQQTDPNQEIIKKIKMDC